MAVLINGMEIPDSCFLCRFCRRQEYGEYVGEDTAWSCVASKKRITDGRDLIATFKHPDCPLVEAAEVKDAVSRQAVLDKAYAYGSGYEPDGFCVDVEDIQALPSVQSEIIRCKDCKHHHYDGDAPYCDRITYGYGWKDDDYCSRAERKTDECN